MMLKYRSMTSGCAPVMRQGFKAVVEAGDPRVTRLGRVLRCGIDELPQLWNIVRGEMAWLGPRPDEAWMVSNYRNVTRERLFMKPGITGLAQILESRNQATAVGYAIDVWNRRHPSRRRDLWVACATPGFILGWRSVGRRYFQELMQADEFYALVTECRAEIEKSESEHAILAERACQ